MVAKRSSLFGSTPTPSKTPDEPVPAGEPDAPTVRAAAAAQAGNGPTVHGRYPKAKTREGKRVATVYLEREALRQLQKIAFEEETTIQALLVEGVNALFERRSLSRIA